ncbi:regulator of G-protein signaling 8 isoform X7 [Prionailurus iriomotensis]
MPSCSKPFEVKMELLGEMYFSSFMKKFRFMSSLSKRKTPWKVFSEGNMPNTVETLMKGDNKDGVAAFRAFLKTEFSEENLEFWLACEEFKKTRSTAKLVSKAHRIFEEFVDVQAPRECKHRLPDPRSHEEEHARAIPDLL